MCGIITAFSKKPGRSKQLVRNQLQEQFHRGKEGFGLITIDKQGKVIVKRSCEPTQIMLDMHFTDAPLMVLHHRFPTSTKNTLAQTHPIRVSHSELKYDYLVVHNGVIGNAKELNEVHKAFGYVYTTEREQDAKYNSKFNDSESLAIEIARYLEGKSPEIGTTGLASFVCIAMQKKTHKAVTFYVGKNTQVLEAYVSESEFVFSSEEVGFSDGGELFYEFSDMSLLTLDVATLLKSKTRPVFKYEPLAFKKPPAPAPVPTSSTAISVVSDYGVSGRTVWDQQSGRYITPAAAAAKKEEQMKRTPLFPVDEQDDYELLSEFEGALPLTDHGKVQFKKIEDRIIHEATVLLKDFCLQAAVTSTTDMYHQLEEMLDNLYQSLDSRLHSYDKVREYDPEFQALMTEKDRGMQRDAGRIGYTPSDEEADEAAAIDEATIRAYDEEMLQQALSYSNY